MRHVLLMVLLGGFMCLCSAARADDYPARKSGLWEVSINTGRANAPNVGMKMCIDATTDVALYKMGMETAGSLCSKRDISRSGSTVTSDSICKIGDTQITSHTVVVYTDNIAYHIDSKAHFDPPMMPGHTDSNSSQDAKWVGPCPADMQPGDMLMPNGVKINVLAAQKGGK